MPEKSRKWLLLLLLLFLLLFGCMKTSGGSGGGGTDLGGFFGGFFGGSNQQQPPSSYEAYDDYSNPYDYDTPTVTPYCYDCFPLVSPSPLVPSNPNSCVQELGLCDPYNVKYQCCVGYVCTPYSSGVGMTFRCLFEPMVV